MTQFAFNTVHDQLRSRVLEAETRIVELLAEQARLKSRMEYAELVLRAIESATHRDTFEADIEALLSEHQAECPEAWYRGE